LSFRQLQVFQTVCERQSYSRAAEQLGLTQPAVSAQIRQLEQSFGQRVFEYVGKQVHLTAAGEQLSVAVESIFADLERLQMELAALQGQVKGELRLAAVSTAQYVVPYLLAGFLEQYPKIDVRLQVVNRAQALERLLQRVDLDAQRVLDALLLIREVVSGSRFQLENGCIRNGLILNPVLEQGSNTTIEHPVLSGLGVAVRLRVCVEAETCLDQLA